ncbi:5'-methylthioadenosine/S-adenosylhomocysteine nucleosidase [Variovorax boronicumulans]|uniref:phosphorylase family protein n=1 Tax=Variovorax boronicumulans TaxID=436515 RepID=UPI000BB3427B|nr:nucleoside phosphorylase [Variovorax boronicumulans]PBI87709.1 5'-methylthioadenosine/S-adenosylhomocysteine nucleosidase [Variovorax boronicumulans]
MKIMLIEDDDAKRRAILAHLRNRSISDRDVILAKSMTDFTANLHANIGLFIIDFNLPYVDDGKAVKSGEAILQSIVKSGKQDAEMLAISAYPDDFPELRTLYESHGCILQNFSNKKEWQSALDHSLSRLKKNVNRDFLIFCALQEERNPYVTLLQGTRINRSGIDCFDVEIGGKQGSVVLMPQMGLVNAAVTAGICIDRFKPLVVGMSGICGGFQKRAHLGQLIVSAMAYEYQSGKWASDGFMHEPYQVATDHLTLTKLRALVDFDNFIRELEEGFTGSRPSEAHKPEVGIFTSGSAVIADSQHMSQIERIHRKVNALDMEVFAVHRAAELSPHKPPCICAKTVVDLGDQNKSDGIHAYGSYISARFLIKAFEEFFADQK